ncbi:head completion/stabilization protein [Bowmanella denitrificans]|uniref:head completion/stabilization protein n=1 Tax=Bowmanella denitrificans TaxID=366582 RepID=UPI000C9C7E11|nr:head completion/stabilization protein [Bowmanella denitrificans]
MSFTGRTKEYLAKVLANDDFYPDISLGDFQQQYRVATDFSQAMVEQCLLLAMIEINTRLTSHKQSWQTAGIYDLDDAPNQPIDGAFTTLYLAAVYHWAKAEVMRRMPTVTDRKTSDTTGEKAEKNEDWYRQQADQYVRQLRGVPGITCELI